MEMKNLIPSLGRILVKKINQREETSGGIILQESSQVKSVMAEIIAVGTFEKDKNYDLKIGDIVFFAKWGGVEVGDFLILKCEEVLCVERKNG